MSEFVQRLANAIMRAENPDSADQYTEMALAVLAAMEQPSQKMIDAAHALDDPGCPNDGDFGHVATVEEHWRAMITAAAQESSD